MPTFNRLNRYDRAAELKYLKEVTQIVLHPLDLCQKNFAVALEGHTGETRLESVLPTPR